MPDQRILLVHAHPDDETIGQGGTMARYVAEGRHVTVVTCTAGELGEVLVPELEHLAADREDRLGEHRTTEIAAAMTALGVTDHRFLGGYGTYRDSGMQWHPDGHAIAADDIAENAFWNADLLQAANQLVEVIRETRPQVLVTYDEFGGYGHPDHIKAHQVAMYAASLAAVPSHRRDLGEAWDISKIYWGAMSESMMRTGLQMLRDSGDTESFNGIDPDGSLPMASPDEDLAACVDAGDHVKAKIEALRAYPTQIAPDSFFFTMVEVFDAVALRLEFYRLAKGVLGPVGENGLEDDLFAGLA
ncbi:MAG: N-acetyl-1-D-myo-inositol-2-amino-2-deoxy-alpha-D-glucopyranoside deacetylase [Nocardioides sp.]